MEYKENKINQPNKTKRTYRYIKQIGGYQKLRRVGGEQNV